MEATQPIVIDENRQAVVGELMRNVYIWMTAGLAITGIVAWLVSSSPAALSLIFGNQVIFWGMLIAELVLVLVLSAAIQKLSFFAAECLFTIYCALNGATFSSIFLLYELGSITEIFFVCAIALAGLIIASIVGLILGKPDSIWMSIIGVVIFAGLTVYDAQKIRLLMLNEETVNDGNMKLALLGALSLYLDFVNLFLQLLRLFGRRR